MKRNEMPGPDGAILSGQFGGLADPIETGPLAQALCSYQARVVDVRSTAPIPWTITVGRPQQGQVNVTNPAYPAGAATEPSPDPCGNYVRIQFGTENIQHVVEVDVGLGCRIPVYGTYVTVDVLQDLSAAPIPFFPTGSVPSPGSIPVSISPGATSPVTPLTRTISLGTVAATLSAIATLPPFTARVEHALSASVTLSRTLQFLRRNSASVITQYTYLVSANRFAPAYPDWTAALPVPWDCSRVLFLNNDATNPAGNVRIICQLAL